MVVEFKKVSIDYEEQSQESELYGELSIPEALLKNRKSTLMPIVIDMNRVLSWYCSKVLFNGTYITCVNVETKEDWLGHIACSPDVFKKIWEQANDKKVYSVEMLKNLNAL